jgi:hypothetical protein
MERTPELDSRDQPDPPAAPASGAISVMGSAVHGLAHGISFLCSAGKKIDDRIGRVVEERSLRTEGKSQALSLIGSGAILISALSPVGNVPIVGAVTYFNANNEFALVIGFLLVGLGIGSLSFALIEKYAWLYPIGFCALLIAIGTLVSWKWNLARASSPPSAPPSGVFEYFTRSASKGLVEHSSLSFGIALLTYGAILVLLAALVRPRHLPAINPESLPG